MFNAFFRKKRAKNFFDILFLKSIKQSSLKKIDILSEGRQCLSEIFL